MINTLAETFETRMNTIKPYGHDVVVLNPDLVTSERLQTYLYGALLPSSLISVEVEPSLLLGFKDLNKCSDYKIYVAALRSFIQKHYDDQLVNYRKFLKVYSQANLLFHAADRAKDRNQGKVDRAFQVAENAYSAFQEVTEPFLQAKRAEEYMRTISATYESQDDFDVIDSIIRNLRTDKWNPNHDSFEQTIKAFS